MTRRWFPSFDVGERVRINGHWEFADGIVGAVPKPLPSIVALAQPFEWQGHRRTCDLPKGRFVFYYVVFDEPADDGSGDGPYWAAVIEADCLELIRGEPSTH